MTIKAAHISATSHIGLSKPRILCPPSRPDFAFLDHVGVVIPVGGVSHYVSLPREKFFLALRKLFDEFVRNAFKSEKLAMAMILTTRSIRRAHIQTSSIVSPTVTMPWPLIITTTA